MNVWADSAATDVARESSARDSAPDGAAPDSAPRDSAAPNSAPRFSTLYCPPHPLNLKQTLRPLSRGYLDPTLRWDGSVVWRTLRTTAGVATLRLEQRADGIRADAWGEGAELAIDGVPELCGAGDDWGELDVSANPFLADSLRRAPGLRLLRTNAVFEAILPAILEQKVTGKEARHAWRVLITKYGEPAPGPAPDGMRVFPSPEVWRRIPSWEWHRAGDPSARRRS